MKRSNASGPFSDNPIETDTPPDDPDADKLKEDCAVFGIWGVKAAAATTALGLHALQHRGQEASGILTYDGYAGGEFHLHRALGHVAGNFDRADVIAKLPGIAAIGHNRYSTTGGTGLQNVQPLFAELSTGGFGLAHNGNLTNAMTLRKKLIERGAIFQTTSDTEVIIHLTALSSYPTLLDRYLDALRQVEGAYALVCLTPEGLIASRDPLGIRPLVLGKLGDTYIAASETVAFDIVGAHFIREVEPGETLVINGEGLRSLKPFPLQPKRPCIFEQVYFSRPDSFVEGRSVYQVRKKIGEELAKEAPVEADMVVPVPDSGTPAALGYAQASGIPFELGIIRSHYIGRTFIQPTDKIRHLGVKLKHNANRAMIAGKRLILVDDSVVRGTTSVKIVRMLREAGAKEVHLRIASPPTRFSCFYGIDTPEESKLLASRMTIEKMCQFIGADSLHFISIDGLYRATGEKGRNNKSPQFCDACFTGDYPTKLTDHTNAMGGGKLALTGGK